MSRIRARRQRHGGAGPVAGVVLAGGRGRRAGGRDKGLLSHLGRPLAAHALARLEPWCDLLIVSANRHRARYRLLADRVVADRSPGYAGPLAGLAAAMASVHAPRWLVCPCDVTDLPAGIPGRLLRALRLHAGVDAAVLHDAKRQQPLVLALRGSVAPLLADYLDSGGRSVHGWLDGLRVAVVRTPVVLSNRNFGGAPVSAAR